MLTFLWIIFSVTLFALSYAVLLFFLILGNYRIYYIFCSFMLGFISFLLLLSLCLKFYLSSIFLTFLEFCFHSFWVLQFLSLTSYFTYHLLCLFLIAISFLFPAFLYFFFLPFLIISRVWDLISELFQLSFTLFLLFLLAFS